MNQADVIFKHNINRIISEGTWDEDPRPKYASDGAPAHSVFITQVFEEYDLQNGELPITTLRPIAIKKGIEEILWIYQDQSNSLDLLEDKYGIKWWRAWDIGDGTIGQRYGATVARYDLMNNLIKGIKEDPFGRRHMIVLWQMKDLEETKGLPPCAFEIMLSVRKLRNSLLPLLDMTLVQRSSDYLVAGHINMMQYVALLMMIAHEVGMAVGKFARLTQNLHIYNRHVEQARELLTRTLSDIQPKLILKADGKSFYDITVDDFELIDYNPVRPQLKFDLGV